MIGLNKKVHDRTVFKPFEIRSRELTMTDLAKYFGEEAPLFPDRSGEILEVSEGRAPMAASAQV